MLKRKSCPPGLHPTALKFTVSLLKWLTNLGLTSGHCGRWAVQSQCRASWFRPEHHLLAKMPVGEAAGYQGEEKTGWDRGCKYVSWLTSSVLKHTLLCAISFNIPMADPRPPFQHSASYKVLLRLCIGTGRVTRAGRSRGG